MIHIRPGARIVEIAPLAAEQQPAQQGVGIKAEQGEHEPMAQGDGACDRAVANLIARQCVEEGLPVSYGGRPGLLISGPNSQRLYRFVSPATGFEDDLPPEALCRHLVQLTREN